MSDLRVTTIDTGYLGRVEFDAAYLLSTGGRAWLIDNGTHTAVPKIEAALESQGLNWDSLDVVFVTHAHLDHAGATSLVMSRSPDAKLVGHPKALRHLSRPDRLIEGVKGVYGEKKYLELYGEIAPIDESRLQPVQDGEELNWCGQTLSFLATEGHASHHSSLWVGSRKWLFSGDAFGLVYPRLAGLAFPSSSPTDFHPRKAIEGVERLSALGPQTVYPTHYGPVQNWESVARQLIKWLEESEQTLEAADASSIDFEAWVWKRIESSPGYQSSWRADLEMDARLNAGGMKVALKRFYS